MNKKLWLEILIISISIFLVNWYYNPNMFKYWYDTLLPSFFIAYPFYVTLYLIIRYFIVSIYKRSIYEKTKADND